MSSTHHSLYIKTLHPTLQQFAICDSYLSSGLSFAICNYLSTDALVSQERKEEGVIAFLN